MSDEPDEGDRDDSERNRPPADQPQGGQPQGDQPQGDQPPNQPQGDQPPNQPQGQPRGQPQGQVRGQQRRGQPPANQAGTGLDIDTAYLQEWAVYFTALFGVAGVSTGLIWIFVGAAEEPILEPSNTLGGALSLLVVQSIIFTLLSVVAVAAVFLGAWLGRKLNEDDNETFVTAGASVAGGAAVFFIIVSVLLSFGFDNLSINFGGILLNTILTAVLAGATTAGGAAVTRNLAPEDL